MRHCRSQGEVNRILGETLDEELDEEFVARQRARLEEMRCALLRGRAGIREEERRWESVTVKVRV